MDTQGPCLVCANNLKIQENAVEISHSQEGTLPASQAGQCAVLAHTRGPLRVAKREFDVCWRFGSCALGAGRPGQVAFLCGFFLGKAKHSEMETLGEEIAFLSLPSCSSQAPLSFTLQGFPFI